MCRRCIPLSCRINSSISSGPTSDTGVWIGRGPTREAETVDDVLRDLLQGIDVDDYGAGQRSLTSVEPAARQGKAGLSGPGKLLLQAEPLLAGPVLTALGRQGYLG